MDIKIPFYREIKALVEKEGFEAYLVGGCVRDHLLNREISDIDMVCFSHDYRDFANAVRILMPSTWVEFKDNIRLVCPGLEIDISKPRGTLVHEDLLKRDFTINNLAMDFNGRIIGDKTDVLNKVIRHVSNDSFKDDPLRLLRAFRFASQLGFKIDNETLEKIKLEKDMISASATERILQEMTKLAGGSCAANAFLLMQESGLYQKIMNGESLSCAGIEAAKSGKGLLFLLSVMILEHPSASVLVKKLNLSNAAARKVTRTAEAAVLFMNEYGRDNKFSQRRLIYAYPDEVDDALEVLLTVYKCKGEEIWDIESFVHAVMIETKNVDFETPMRINGGFLMNMGITAGKVMGTVIDDVRPLLASGELMGLEEAEEYIVKKYLKG